VAVVDGAHHFLDIDLEVVLPGVPARQDVLSDAFELRHDINRRLLVLRRGSRKKASVLWNCSVVL
jgi:hypothetical protein